MLAFLLLVLLPLACCHAGPAITPDQAAAHLGETATVEGVVSAVSTSKKGNIFLNFGGKFPHQIFTAYVPSTAGLDFAEMKSLEGKTVLVTGVIANYKGKPEIIVNKRNQIEP